MSIFGPKFTWKDDSIRLSLLQWVSAQVSLPHIRWSSSLWPQWTKIWGKCCNIQNNHNNRNNQNNQNTQNKLHNRNNLNNRNNPKLGMNWCCETWKWPLQRGHLILSWPQDQNLLDVWNSVDYASAFCFLCLPAYSPHVVGKIAWLVSPTRACIICEFPRATSIQLNPHHHHHHHQGGGGGCIEGADKAEMATMSLRNRE